MTRWLFALRSRVRSIVRRGTIDREMQEEMALHLAEATERLMRRGLSENDARATARREFGNVGALQEEGRDARGARWIESCAGDVRFAFRHFTRIPLTTITLVLVLALGIGVNSAIFSILQTLTMRPAPGVPANAALVRVRGKTLVREDGRLSPRLYSLPELQDLATRHGTFAAVAAYARQEVVLDLADGTDTRSVTANFVAPNYFTTLGIRPALGPGLPNGSIDDTPGIELSVVIGHFLWEQMGSDTAAIGRVIRLNGVPVRIVGVAPPNFRGATINAGDPLLFLPMAARTTLMATSSRALTSRDSTFADAIALLAPDVTVEQATSVARVIATTWSPDSVRTGDRVVYASDVVPLRGITDVNSDSERALFAGLAGTGALLVLLVVCSNVSALLIGAAVARRREIAIRLSLGASRRRIVRQLVTESTLVAFAGGALGLAIYWAITRLLAWYLYEIGIGPDLATVAFTTLIALGTGIVFGLSPALHATRLDVATTLKSSGGGTARTRLQRAFIIAQIALTQPLLVGIALVIAIVTSEVNSVQSDDPLTKRVIRVQLAIASGGVGTRDAKETRVARLMDRVAALPGVEAVVPQSAAFDIADFRALPADRGTGTRAEETVRAHVEGAPPGYFAFQHIPMLRGRDLTADDTASKEMAVVIATDLARGFWGSADPVGKRLQVSMLSSRERERSPTPAVVVGVFDTTQAPLRGMGRVYTATGARWPRDTYLVQTRGPGEALLPDVRRLARTMVPDIPVFQRGIVTLEQLARMERVEIMQISGSAAAGGAIALLLASIGLYGIVALAVRQRHREIGIRVALGARPTQVTRMFFANGVRVSILGVVLGVPLSVFAAQALASSVADMRGFPLSRTMMVAGAGVAAVVVVVAAIASWFPARRASRVDPLVAIRAE